MQIKTHPVALGLNADEADMPGGFSQHVNDALAHLRESWFQADSSNRPIVEQAIRTLLTTLTDHPDLSKLAVKVLLHGHQRGAELLRGIRP